MDQDQYEDQVLIQHQPQFTCTCSSRVPNQERIAKYRNLLLLRLTIKRARRSFGQLAQRTDDTIVIGREGSDNLIQQQATGTNAEAEVKEIKFDDDADHAEEHKREPAGSTTPKPQRRGYIDPFAEEEEDPKEEQDAVAAEQEATEPNQTTTTTTTNDTETDYKQSRPSISTTTKQHHHNLLRSQLQERLGVCLTQINRAVRDDSLFLAFTALGNAATLIGSAGHQISRVG